MLKWAGIGSRETPLEYMDRMGALGYYLTLRGDLFTSGNAPGPDKWFMRGVDLAMADMGVTGRKEIQLPWQGFEGGYDSDPQYRVIDGTEQMLARVILHDSGVCRWLNKVTQGVTRLFCRNVYQILWSDWSKVDFVVFYAKENKEKGTVDGGTAIAVKLARHLDIPCYNLMFEEDRQALYEFIGFTEADYAEYRDKHCVF